MKMLPLGLLAGLLLLGLSNTAHSQILIDFDALASGGFVEGTALPVAARLSNQFLSTHGVAFDSGAGYVGVVNLGAGHATSGTNGISGSTDAGLVTYSNAFPITITFFDPLNPSVFGITDFVSIRGDLRGNNLRAVTLEAFDVAGSLLGSDTRLDTGGITLSIMAPGMHSVRFSGTELLPNNGGGVALDDLRFNPVRAVPEPARALLTLLGLGAVLVRRRR